MSPRKILNVYFPYLPNCIEFPLAFFFKKTCFKFKAKQASGCSVEGA